MRTNPLDPQRRPDSPLSQLPVDRRPAWQDIELTDDYRVSFSIIDGRILHTRPVGNAGPSGMPRLFDKRRVVLQEAGLWSQPYCEIKDYEGVVLGHPRLGRVQFSELLSAEYDRGMLRGYWGYGGPRVYRWIMVAAKALSAHPDGPVHFVSDYTTALREALERLQVPLPHDLQPPSNVTCRDDWTVAVGGYRNTFEVWDGSLLVSHPQGRLTRTAAAQLFDLIDRIVDDLGLPPEGTFGQLTDLSRVHHVDWNALRYIRLRYRALHDRHPCRGVVTYGTERFFVPMARLATTALPFPYVVVSSREDGLRAARNLPRIHTQQGWLDRLRGKTRYSGKELGRLVSNVIEYAATINWHAKGIGDPEVSSDDPMAPLYALLRVLKLDFDTVLADRERMQAEMLQAAKLASIGRLAAGMAHELNSPLTAVMGYAEHIQRQSTDAHSAAHAGQALKCALRMRDIIDQLSAYSRSDSEVAPHPVDINDCIEESLGLIDPLMEQHRVVVQRELGDQLPPVLCTVSQLQSVFFNVLVNAFDAYDDQGGDSNPVRISTRHVDDDVEIHCQDWGSGMSRQAQAKAFDPFFTTKDVGEGTGLGLYVTHRIVTGSGGTIQLQSAPGEGTTVIIRLPGVTEQ